jgi:hypothetical protein
MNLIVIHHKLNKFFQYYLIFNEKSILSSYSIKMSAFITIEPVNFL